jgi:hypothetical protein
VLLQIHWFSIINSCVTVLLLTGFLTTILLRVLKNDFLKYTRDDEMGEAEEETGWKYLHGDVFRWAGRLQGVMHTHTKGSTDGAWTALPSCCVGRTQ